MIPIAQHAMGDQILYDLRHPDPVIFIVLALLLALFAIKKRFRIP